MARTLLSLSQDLHRETGAAGVAPSSVASPTGEWARLINYIINADLEIQEMYEDWKFLRTEYSNAMSAGVNTLAAPTGVKFWDPKTFQIIEYGGAATDRYPIEVFEYDDIKSEVLDETTQEVPWRVIIMPDLSLKLELVPDAAHTLYADYYVHPTAMSGNTSESAIPDAYRLVILGRALQMYGEFEGASEIIAKGTRFLDLWFPRLENNQLPNKHHARFRGSGGHFEVIGSQGQCSNGS